MAEIPIHRSTYSSSYYTMVPLEVVSTFVVSILIAMAVVVGHAAPMHAHGWSEGVECMDLSSMYTVTEDGM